MAGMALSPAKSDLPCGPPCGSGPSLLLLGELVGVNWGHSPSTVWGSWRPRTDREAVRGEPPHPAVQPAPGPGQGPQGFYRFLWMLGIFSWTISQTRTLRQERLERLAGALGQDMQLLPASRPAPLSGPVTEKPLFLQR